MPSSTVRPVLVGLAVPALAAVVVVGTAGPAAAHESGGGDLPAPTWLLGYLGAFLVLATALVLRGSWAQPRLAMAGAGHPVGDDVATDVVGAAEAAASPPAVTVGALAALALYVGAVVVALAGPNTPASNLAPVAVLVVWWVVLPLVALVVGDVLRVANPFVPVVALVERTVPALRDRAGVRVAPVWTAAALLWGFRWLFVAYYRPGSPRAVALLLIAYGLAAVAGGLVWGRGWLRTGEGFGALSAAVGGLVRGRRPLQPGALLPLAVTWLGTTAFDAVTATELWGDVLGTSRGWTRTLLNTVGLVWITGIVAAVALAAVRLGQRSAATAEDDPTADDDPARHGLVGVVGLALIPLAVAWSLSHDLTLLLFEGQNFLILLSDPLGRGWDLFGTIDHTIDTELVRAGWVRWVQLGALVAGHVAAVVLAHDGALARLGRRRGMQVTWAVAVLAAASAVAAAALVLA